MASKKYKIIFVDEALEDIDLIYYYITTQLHNKDAAGKLRKLIRKKIEKLKEFPLSCPLITHPALADDELRKLVINDQFLALYLVDEADKTVYITGVYNSARDYIQFLIDN
jgi:plasmid stabilization system protein ParE